MWNEPPFLLILGAVIGTVYFGYLFYQIWFDSERLYQQSKKAMRKLPSWYPLKRYYLWRLGDKKSWGNERKVMSRDESLPQYVKVGFIRLVDANPKGFQVLSRWL